MKVIGGHKHPPPLPQYHPLFADYWVKSDKRLTQTQEKHQWPENQSHGVQGGRQNHRRGSGGNDGNSVRPIVGCLPVFTFHKMLGGENEVAHWVESFPFFHCVPRSSLPVQPPVRQSVLHSRTGYGSGDGCAPRLDRRRRYRSRR